MARTSEVQTVDNQFRLARDKGGEGNVVSANKDIEKPSENLELDERELEPAAVVFLTYPFILLFFVFLAIAVLWYFGFFGYSDVN